MHTFFNKHTHVALVFGLALTHASQSYAAPGDIAQSPLFASGGVQPNIFFLIDDSGSMDWEVLKSNGAITVHGSGNNSGNLDFTPNDTTEIRELCVGYNTMAYNPDPKVSYAPWAGEDSAGVAYKNQTISAARTDPYNTSTVSLASHFYFVWNDADADDTYDAGECPDNFAAYDTSGGGTLSTTECAAVSGCVLVSSLSAAEQTRYANWYSYYRKREFVAKKALSELTVRSTARMGLATLHNNNSVGTPVKDVDDLTLPIDTVAQANKKALLKQLFRINSSGGTPLRQALRNAGNYYQGSGGVGNLFGGSTPASPILSQANGGECQQNFTVLMSDGFWNGGSPSVGNTDIDGPGPFDGGVYGDNVSDTLADVAMKYYETDLSNLADNVPTLPGVDENKAQHMVTYTVAFGIDGTLNAGPGDKDTSFNWPTPVANASTTIDDLRHAAFNGRGLFLDANDPEELVASLGQAIADIQSRESTASAVSFNTTSIQTGSLVFQALFNSRGWHGNLRAFPISKDGVIDINNPAWDAAQLLDEGVGGRDLASNPREIITYNGTSGVAFRWPAGFVFGAYTPNLMTDLSQLQVNDLLTNVANRAVGTSENEYGQAILDFLRGNHSNELPAPPPPAISQLFRDRGGKRLGDIVNSSPLFVGAPNTPYPDNIESKPYSSFVQANKNRTSVVYVGANDGMLHAFDADTNSGTPDGEEIFAYIPGALFSTASKEGLHYLADPAYKHRYYVDLSPISQDVFIGGDWRTYLVGGLRAGGKAIFALDITDPGALTEANASNIVKWEFTHPDLGFTFSDIQIARMNNGRWAAIFGNGYNNDPIGDGRAKLFIKYLDNPADVEIIDTKEGFVVSNDCSDPLSNCNGLSSPNLSDLNGDGNVDRVYAGDLQGNMWVFDVSDSNAVNWDSAYLVGTTPKPLFQACNSASCTNGNGQAINRQPITTKPSLYRHPTRNSEDSEPNMIVLFGTGQYVTTADNFSSGTQSFYGVWDGTNYGLANSPVTLNRADLVQQVTGETSNGSGIREPKNPSPVNYDPIGSPAEYGWYIDLPDPKERTIVDPILIGSNIFFPTYVPTATVCNADGYSWTNFVNALTGGKPIRPVLDLDDDGDFTNDPFITGIRSDGLSTSLRPIDDNLVGTKDGKLDSEKIESAQGGSFRQSWIFFDL